MKLKNIIIGSGLLVGIYLISRPSQSLPNYDIYSGYPSDTLRYSNDTIESTPINQSIPFKVKEIKLNGMFKGGMRIHFEMFPSMISHWIVSQIYINGIQKGTSRANNQLYLYDEDIKNLDLPSGSTVEIWSNCMDCVNSNIVSIQNFRLLYDDAPRSDLQIGDRVRVMILDAINWGTITYMEYTTEWLYTVTIDNDRNNPIPGLHRNQLW